MLPAGKRYEGVFEAGIYRNDAVDRDDILLKGGTDSRSRFAVTIDYQVE